MKPAVKNLAPIAIALASLCSCAHSYRAPAYKLDGELFDGDELLDPDGQARAAIIKKMFLIYERTSQSRGMVYWGKRYVGKGGGSDEFLERPLDKMGDEMSTGSLLAMERQALERMRTADGDLMTPAEIDHYLDVSRDTFYDQTLHVAFHDRTDDDLTRSPVLAMLKLVNGHRRNYETFTPADLPWMKDFPDLKARMDRGREKYVYELARAMGDPKDEVLFRFCAALMVREAATDVIRRGGRLQDAYVYVHTINEVATRHFTTGIFPWKKWDVPGLPAGHSILKASLAELYDHPRFKPYVYFKGLDTLVKTLKPARPSEAIDFLGHTQGRLFIDFEVRDATTGKVVGTARLKDRTRLIEWRTQVNAAAFNQSLDRVRELSVLERFSRSLTGRWPQEGRWMDEEPLIKFQWIGKPGNVRNLDLTPVLDYYRDETARLDELAARARRPDLVQGPHWYKGLDFMVEAPLSGPGNDLADRGESLRFHTTAAMIQRLVEHPTRKLLRRRLRLHPARPSMGRFIW